MNNFKFLPLALAALMLGSCSNEDLLGKNDGGNGEVNRSYMSINLLSAGGAGSRADSYYENGSEAENAVTTTRIYLFDASGNAYTVGTEGKNYVDVDYKPSNNTNADATVEEIGEAVIVINGTTSAPPHSMVAVLNAPEALGDEAKTLAQLTTALNCSAATSGNFVMSNSVYTGAGVSNGATLVDGHIGKTETDAKNNPVDVYVERVLAKVVATDNRSGEGITAGTYEVGTMGTDKVYAKILGWGVADYNQQSYLLKKISASWTDENLGFSPWNNAFYHRSFWAESVPLSNTGNSLGNQNFTTIQKTSLGTGVYTQEQTPNAVVADNSKYLSSNGLTKAIFVAQLVDANGDAIELCEYYGTQYIGENAVKQVIANKYATTYWKRSESYSEENKEYVSIAPTDLVFKATTTNAQIKDYEVVAEVNSGVKLYVADETAADKYKEVSAADVNKELAKNPAKIRKSGYTYYYTPIEHLGSANTVAQYGVVRNHVYKINVTSISGFGTPVYDPTKTIIPTIPTDDNSYVAARINILQWRIVSKDVSLDATQKN